MRLILEIEFTVLQIAIVFMTIRSFKFQNDKNRELKNFILFVLFIILAATMPEITSQKIACIEIIHSILFMISILVNKKEGKIYNIVIFSLSYFVVVIIGILFRNRIVMSRIFYNADIFSHSQEYYITLQVLIISLLIYFSQIIKNAKAIVKFICRKKVRINILILCDFFCDILLVADIENNKYWILLVKSIIIMIACILIFIAVNYFLEIKIKSSKVKELNVALENKNDELRKIKHDYGAQISYLYGLHLLKRYDDLEKSLEEICETNESVSSGVASKNVEDSVVYEALKPLLKAGVHIILDQSVELNQNSKNKDIIFDIVSLIRVILAKDMNNEGMIYAKVYKSLGNIIIKIENNELNLDKKHTFEGGVLDKLYKLFELKRKDNNELFLNELVESIEGKLYIKRSNGITRILVVLSEE